MTFSHKPYGDTDADSQVYTTFLLTGDGVNHEILNQVFNVDPDIWVEKGKKFTTPTGKISSSVGRVNVWGLTSRNRVKSSYLNSHISWLFDELGIKENKFLESLDRKQVRVSILCYCRGQKIGREINQNLEEIINNKKIEIDFDSYE